MRAHSEALKKGVEPSKTIEGFIGISSFPARLCDAVAMECGAEKSNLIQCVNSWM